MSTQVVLNTVELTVAPGSTFNFIATVIGNADTSVTWAVDGIVGGNSTVGTISGTGVYTAPVGPGGQHSITATSVAVPTAYGLAIVIVPFSTGVTSLSGDVTTSTGTGVLSSTVVAINGSSVPLSAKLLSSDASGQLTAAVVAGSGSGTTTGPTSSVSGDVVTFTGTAGQIADSGTLLTALAPIASPTFTGTVTAPALTLNASTGIILPDTTNGHVYKLTFVNGVLTTTMVS